MPTIRAVFPITMQFSVEVTRDFDLNGEYQIAEALYRQIIAMDDSDAIDFLIEAITTVGEGKPTIPRTDVEQQ
ncbi:MAG: hypothetical protein IT318_16385 [Anaerolineales bacterium]|nr:hypothetical protein [Anaerolineales bacterium]